MCPGAEFWFVAAYSDLSSLCITLGRNGQAALISNARATHVAVIQAVPSVARRFQFSLLTYSDHAEWDNIIVVPLPLMQGSRK